MAQHGIHWIFNIVLLTCLTTVIPNIWILADETTECPNYDVIDVAKVQTANGKTGKSQGHTTRIFTTGDVDENFWLKYLGEEYRNAVYFQVDDDNNVRPHHTEKNNINELNEEEKGTNSVSKPAEEKDNEHTPV